jgi:uncharacterized membrane protein YiaA
MITFNSKLIFWIVGITMAFVGVLVVRVVVPTLVSHHKMVMLMGYGLALFGLFLITLGTRRK